MDFTKLDAFPIGCIRAPGSVRPDESSEQVPLTEAEGTIAALRQRNTHLIRCAGNSLTPMMLKRTLFTFPSGSLVNVSLTGEPLA